MSLVNEPRLFEDENGVGPAGSEQRMRLALKSGLGPLTGLTVLSGTRSVSSNQETYIFFSDNAATQEVARVVLTYADSTLNEFTGWVWTLA